MKIYVILGILLTNIITIMAQTKHDVRFIIRREQHNKEDNSNPYTIEIELKDQNAKFKAPDDKMPFPQIPTIVSFPTQTIKTESKKLIFNYSENKKDPNTTITVLKQPIINLNTYLTNEILTQILNRDEGNQIDITIDIFAAQNDFTRPYKDLYLKIKEFCKQIGVEIIEPTIEATGLFDTQGLWQQYIGKKFQFWHW